MYRDPRVYVYTYIYIYIHVYVILRTHTHEVEIIYNGFSKITPKWLNMGHKSTKCKNGYEYSFLFSRIDSLYSEKFNNPGLFVILPCH